MGTITHLSTVHAMEENTSGKILVGKARPTVSERNTENELPFHLLCKCDAEKVDHDSPECIEAIWLLLLAHPETVQI